MPRIMSTLLLQRMFFTGGFLDFCYVPYFNKHCVICRSLDFTLSERRMLGLNPGLLRFATCDLRLWHWQPEALTTRLEARKGGCLFCSVYIFSERTPSSNLVVNNLRRFLNSTDCEIGNVKRPAAQWKWE